MVASDARPSEPPGRSRRGRRRDPAVDEAILAAAVDLLAEAGYARLTMGRVATRAQVGKASLYLRWPNKVALVAEAIQWRSRVVPEVPDTGNLREDMLAFLRALVRGYWAAGGAVAAVAGEIASNPELRTAWRKTMTTTLWNRTREIVERAVQRGELPPASDVELLSMLPLTMLQSWRAEHGRGPDDAAVERIVDQFYTPGQGRATRAGGNPSVGDP
jgi:AcrR family transcriptional regulator